MDREAVVVPLMKRDRDDAAASLSRFAGRSLALAEGGLDVPLAATRFGAASGGVTAGSVAGVSDSKLSGEDFVTFIIGPILGDKPIRIKHTPRGANHLKTNGDWPGRKQTFYLRG